MILLKFCLWVRHSCNNKIKQSLSKFFFLSQFVNWVAWGQARFEAWGVDTSPSYLLFQTLLPLFWTLICMIWMELTRTNVVFSRIAMVLFLRRNKSSRNDLEIYEDFCGIYKKYWRKNQPEEWREEPTSPPRAPPWTRLAGLWGPRSSAASNSSSI